MKIPEQENEAPEQYMTCNAGLFKFYFCLKIITCLKVFFFSKETWNFELVYSEKIN